MYLTAFTDPFLSLPFSSVFVFSFFLNFTFLPERDYVTQFRLVSVCNVRAP